MAFNNVGAPQLNSNNAERAHIIQNTHVYTVRPRGVSVCASTDCTSWFEVEPFHHEEAKIEQRHKYGCKLI